MLRRGEASLDGLRQQGMRIKDQRLQCVELLEYCRPRKLEVSIFQIKVMTLSWLGAQCHSGPSLEGRARRVAVSALSCFPLCKR